MLERLPAGADVVVASAVGMERQHQPRRPLARDARGCALGRPARCRRCRSDLALARRRSRRGCARRSPRRSPTASRSISPLGSSCGATEWASTRAFAHPADNQGYVRFNIEGRERDGIVAPGEVDALVEEIAVGLATFSDPDGAPAVAEVVRIAERYPGDRSERLPDLAVRWLQRPATSLTGVRSPRFGEVTRRGSGSGRSGNHTPGDAWALVVPGASSAREPTRPARLVDVAATVCEVVGADRGGLPGEPLLMRAGGAG